MRSHALRAARLAAGLAVITGLMGCGDGAAPVDDPWGDEASLAFPGAHVMLISVDTLRADRLGSYGYERDTTPNLDALAAESILFEQVFSHSPKTASSHMSLFTSLLPSVHKVRNASSRLELPVLTLAGNRMTLPQVLNQSGYLNAAVACAGNIIPDMGFKRGFKQRFVSKMDDVTWHASQSLLRWNEVLADSEARSGFVFMHTYQVHGPYLPPKAFRERFAPTPSGMVTERVAAYSDLPFDQQWRGMNKGLGNQPPFWDGKDEWGPDEARYLSDLYDGEVAYTDDVLGDLIDDLRDLGLLDKMVLVILSDHGEEFYEHGSWEHDQLYAEHLHVPLIVRLPGGRRGGTRVTGTAGLIDVMPTLLELIELEGPPTMDGTSLVPAIESGRTQNRPVVAERVMFLPYGEYAASLRSASSQVTFDIPRGADVGQLSAFDLTADPGELSDVFDEAAFAEPAADALWRELSRAFSAQAALDAVDSGRILRLTDAAKLTELEALGYTDGGEDEPLSEEQLAETPLVKWPGR